MQEKQSSSKLEFAEGYRQHERAEQQLDGEVYLFVDQPLEDHAAGATRDSVERALGGGDPRG